MDGCGLPFVKGVCLDTGCGCNGLDGVAGELDGRQEQGFGLGECGVLFHSITSKG